MSIYRLYDEDTVYRPPEEAQSILFEFSYGCSYAKCAFCHYSIEKKPLMMADEAHLKARLETLGAIYPDKNRLFMLGGNALAYKSEYLLEIFSLIKIYIPSVTEICMYARADDVNSKSAENLRALKEKGLNTLYIGLESGDDNVLKLCNKGVTSTEFLEAFSKLDKAGILYGLTSILGLGGKNMWKEHAVNTGKIYSMCHPHSIRTLTLRAEKGTALYEDIEKGGFIPLTAAELLYEQRLLVENIDLESKCVYVGDRDNFTKVSGILPMAKDGLLRIIDAAIRESVL